MSNTNEFQSGYELLFELLRSVSEECAEDLEAARLQALEVPDTDAETRRFLSHCIDTACAGARRRGDDSTAQHLETNKERILEQVIEKRRSASGERAASTNTTEPHAEDLLESFQGVDPHPVKPSPYFHGYRVAVREGFVDVGNIRLRKATSGSRSMWLSSRRRTDGHPLRTTS